MLNNDKNHEHINTLRVRWVEVLADNLKEIVLNYVSFEIKNLK